MHDEVYITEDAKWRAIVQKIRELHRENRPVLVETRSVAASEHLSAFFAASSAHCQTDEEEAQIVAQAGQAGRITVATNMAGRGTDIMLAQGVEEAGGFMCSPQSGMRRDS
jgi:preprotein translocase subunit SecA